MTKKSAHPMTVELRRLMKRHNLTQLAIAKLAGCKRNTVCYWLKETPIIPESRLRLLKFELKVAKSA